MRFPMAHLMQGAQDNHNSILSSPIEGRNGNGNLTAREIEYMPVPLRESCEQGHDVFNRNQPLAIKEPQQSKEDAIKSAILESERSIGWQTPALLLGTFMVGVLLALTHHLYNSSLNGTLVGSQSHQAWVKRVGTGLAFLVKTAFVAAVGVAICQQIWMTLRRKTISLGGIDCMFSIAKDPSSFFSWDLLRRAKTLTLISTISWCIPIVVVLAPASLSVQSSNWQMPMTPQTVQTVDFADGTGFYTGFEADTVAPIVRRMFTAVYSSASVLPQPAKLPNSSYILNFWGPSYKCQNLSDTISISNLESELAATNYTSLQNVFDRVVWEPAARDNSDLMYYGNAPKFILNQTILLHTPGSFAESNMYGGKNLSCRQWNTSYAVRIQFNNGVQTVVPLSVDLLRPMNQKPASYAPDRSLLAWSAIHELMAELLSSSLTTTGAGGLAAYTTTDSGHGASLVSPPIMQSGLLACPDIWNSTSGTRQTSFQGSDNPHWMCRNQSIERAIEDLSRNFTYSLLTYPRWTGIHNVSTPVSVFAYQTFYVYDQISLVVPYGAAAIATLICIGVGLYALWSNGIESSISFSTVLLTTRNFDLDELAIGHRSGAKPLATELGNTRLQFGTLNMESKGNHPAFGFEGTITSLVKDKGVRLDVKESLLDGTEHHKVVNQAAVGNDLGVGGIAVVPA